jgi:ABC-type histidine transport system ATPase subunit
VIDNNLNKAELKVGDVILSVKNLCKYFGNNKVLDGINIDVKKGDVVAIVGPSGCGKSTFLRCLNLLETPSGGEIIFEDEYLFKLFSLYTKEEILQLKAIIREQKKKGEDFCAVLHAIESTVRQQQVENAIVGNYKENIVSRIHNLSDTINQVVSGNIKQDQQLSPKEAATFIKELQKKI